MATVRACISASRPADRANGFSASPSMASAAIWAWAAFRPCRSQGRVRLPTRTDPRLAEGRDPLAEKRRAKLPTFGEAARKVHEANLPRWRNGKHTANWMTTLVRHALPVIGDMPVDRIGREDVLRVLTPIWTAKPETARRVRQRIRAVLRWCQAHGFVEFNMAGEVIDGALPLTSKMKAHFRALPYREVTGLLATVEASRASLSTKLCLRFLILTAARSGEARGATWDEIDLDACEWRIPGERMKAGVAHRVPLSDAALIVLTQACTLRDETGLVFPVAARENAVRQHAIQVAARS